MKSFGLLLSLLIGACTTSEKNSQRNVASVEIPSLMRSDIRKKQDFTTTTGLLDGHIILNSNVRSGRDSYLFAPVIVTPSGVVYHFDKSMLENFYRSVDACQYQVEDNWNSRVEIALSIRSNSLLINQTQEFFHNQRLSFVDEEFFQPHLSESRFLVIPYMDSVFSHQGKIDVRGYSLKIDRNFIYSGQVVMDERANACHRALARNRHFIESVTQLAHGLVPNSEREVSTRVVFVDKVVFSSITNGMVRLKKIMRSSIETNELGFLERGKAKLRDSNVLGGSINHHSHTLSLFNPRLTIELNL